MVGWKALHGKKNDVRIIKSYFYFLTGFFWNRVLAKFLETGVGLGIKVVGVFGKRALFLCYKLFNKRRFA